MDGYALSADIYKTTLDFLKALLWPATVCFVVWYLREPFERYLPFLQRLEFQALKLDFEKEAIESKEKRKEASPAELKPREQVTIGTSEHIPATFDEQITVIGSHLRTLRESFTHHEGQHDGGIPEPRIHREIECLEATAKLLTQFRTSKQMRPEEASLQTR